MFCKKCGNEISDRDNFCTRCGYQVKEVEKEAPAEEISEAPAEVAVEAAMVQAEPKAPAVAPAVEGKKKMAGKAVAGFVVSLAGLLVSPIICGIIGIILSVKGMKQTKSGELRGRGLAIAGLVLGIISIPWGIYNFINTIVQVLYIISELQALEGLEGSILSIL